MKKAARLKNRTAYKTYIYIIRYAASGPSLFKVIEVIKTEAAKSMCSHNVYRNGYKCINNFYSQSKNREKI